MIQHSINDWTVNLDMDSTEYYAGEKIKRALARYPLHVIRADVDPETNPFGLQWDLLLRYASAYRTRGAGRPHQAGGRSMIRKSTGSLC